jgi:hypothetical protein
VEGKIGGVQGEPVSSYISVIDLLLNKKILQQRPAADGTFSLYIPEGSQYELSVDPEQSDYTYFSKYYDLKLDKIPQKDKVNIVLKRVERGDEFPLDMVSFKPFTTELTDVSKKELVRLSRLIKFNPDVKFEIQIAMSGFKQDSIKSSPDLTEMKIDSVLVQADTSLNVPEHKVARITYHNDATLKQADAINKVLYREGVTTEHVEFVVSAIESTEPPEVRIKAVAR